ASCDGMSGTIPITVTAGQTVATVALSPNPLTIVQGMTGKPTVTLKDASGALVYRTPSFSTGNSAIATVSVDGTVTGVSAGTTTLTASIDGKSATITVTVTNESTTVASVVITPSNPSIMVGNEVQFTAVMKNAQGTVLSGKTVTWGSSNYLVGYQMNTTGLVYGREAGTSVISATSEGVTGTTVLTVGAKAAPVAYVGVTPTPSTIAVGGTVQLSAQLRDASGNILTGRTITWSSANSAIASVSASGLVTGKSAGTTTVSATADGVSGSATVTVTGTGGGGGGGGGTGSVCSSVTSVGAPAPGNSTSWLPTQFKGMDYMISTGTVNYGTQAAPKYGYTVMFRNRYTQEIGFSARGPVDYVPTTPFYTKTLGAGLTGASNTEYWAPPSTLWVYISNLRVGTTTGYCE
ncbi:MAG TPA: Ig-like domain-containing protein, partial [Gemmatimonadaceae bacterium]|nr:Ig-like domain-containing protein [Gemmatimonadaceae bacterium]